MDFETYKKTKLTTSGICPKCVKHFDRLRTHANACLKNIYQNYMSLDSNDLAKDEEQVKEIKETKKSKINKENDEPIINKVKEIKISKSKLPKLNKENSSTQLILESNEKKSIEVTTESKLIKKSDDKPSEERSKPVETVKPVATIKPVETIKPVQATSTEIESNKENSLVTSIIKIGQSKQAPTEPDIEKKFQELYETVLDGLNNETISNRNFRFDFAKLTLEVKVGDKNNNNKPLQAIENSNDDKPIQSIQNQAIRNLSKQTNQKITPVLFVTNLDSNEITVDNLFILFGVYGDVVRIKILDKKLAFIEFVSKDQAEIALNNLDNCKFYDQVMRVYSSVYETVSLNQDTNRQCIVKDFTNSNLHRYRFRKPDAHHFINRPSATLHLSNIPVNVSENDINYLFEQYGVVRELRFDLKHPGRALIQMKSLDQAVIALVKLHGKQLNKNQHLRCNFHQRNLI